jgi:hypothetical protein
MVSPKFTTQSYEIYNIPIHVRYNMTDAEK